MERWLEDGDAAGLAVDAGDAAGLAESLVGGSSEEEVVVAVAAVVDFGWAEVDWEEEVLTAAAS